MKVANKQAMPRQAKMTETEMLNSLRGSYGSEISASDVRAFCAMNDITYQTVTKRLDSFKTGRGKWNLELTKKDIQLVEDTYHSLAAEPAVLNQLPSSTQNLVPDNDSNFVAFGNFTDLKKIIQSGMFYPTFITGLSGNGKTMGVEQACAQLKRELIRVNITIETDEDDLIGGFRLVNGETVWHNGPVIEALQRGAILLLDEIDLASNKILCLQSILEGKGVFLKKIGQFIQPKAGFNVIATANTKGKGSDDGRFIGTNVLNEAFLERFPITFEQEYPSAQIETRMLKRYAESLGLDDGDFCKRLADWSDIIRRTFFDGGVDEIISTRRLVHIIRAYSIFQNKEKAIRICLNRFDDETKQSFVELYDKIDADFNMEEPEQTEVFIETVDSEN